jgi:hypothetical protein
MLPTEISYLAQERCKELRGEIREPGTSFFEPSLKVVFANFFSRFGQRLESKPSQSKKTARG